MAVPLYFTNDQNPRRHCSKYAIRLSAVRDVCKQMSRDWLAAVISPHSLVTFYGRLLFTEDVNCVHDYLCY